MPFDAKLREIKCVAARYGCKITAVHMQRDLPSRMELTHHIFEVFATQVCVNFSGGDALVAQHFLYSTQIGTCLYHVRCKGMAEGMWTNILPYPTHFSSVFYDVENRNT
jgi:hypothetical protein